VTWSNWAGNQTCKPTRMVRPRTEAELVRLVETAATDGHAVRVVGAGHSFTPLVCTDGVLVDLADYGSVLEIDRSRRQVRVEAGMPLWRLNQELASAGLALENLGDIAYQSVAGATQTATHGTGARFRNLSSAIVGMRLIDGTGQVVECAADVELDVFRSARVAIGALGLVSTVTLQCVDAFNLHAVERPEPVDDVLDDLDANVDGNDHFEFFWVPNTRWALTKRNRRTTEAARPRSTWRAWRDDVLYDNVLFGAMCRIGLWRNEAIPKVAKRLPSKGAAEYVDASYRVFASPRRVRFYEMEYAIPRAALVEALQRVRDHVRRLGTNISFPVEVRFVAADDIPLSTAQGRDTAYIAVHVYRGTPYDQYFQGVEQIMNDYGGRPHWGKMHFQSAETLAPRYPLWDDFQAVRARLDPAGVFATPYIERVLGPVGG
jgi:L-gulono-1,4-lactone dehydrogenase